MFCNLHKIKLCCLHCNFTLFIHSETCHLRLPTFATTLSCDHILRSKKWLFVTFDPCCGTIPHLWQITGGRKRQGLLYQKSRQKYPPKGCACYIYKMHWDSYRKAVWLSQMPEWAIVKILFSAHFCFVICNMYVHDWHLYTVRIYRFA